MWMDDLHAEPDCTVRGIPKANVAPKPATRWWIPRHNENKHIDREGEQDRDSPDLKLATDNASLLPIPTDQQQPETHREHEHVAWVTLQVHDKVEGVAGRWCESHEERQAPFEHVWCEGCVKWLGRSPHPRKGKNTLTPALTDDTRRADNDRDDISKGREGDEEVQTLDRVALAEDSGEEEGGSKLFG